MDDLIRRQDAIRIAEQGLIQGYLWQFEQLVKLPSAESSQKTGKWIDKSRGEQKNSECSECHTLFRVLIHDYPYCPCCGSRNRGEEDE